MIWRPDYISIYLSARKNINVNNIDKLNAKQIEHIGKLYKEEYFDHYKKTVFFRWFTENSENTTSFARKAKKILKNLNIELSGADLERINNIEPREFTERRALKTIEVPYKDLIESNQLEGDAIFFYKNVRLYRFNKTLYRQDFRGEIYITRKEVVFYDRTNHRIDEVITFGVIEEVTLKKFGVELQIVDENPIYIRYKDNELIFISLSRALPSKVDIDFLNEAKEDGGVEKTIEAILDVNYTERTDEKKTH